MFGSHLEFLDRILEKSKLDGVEVFHSSFSGDQMEEIDKYADEKGIYKSMGSDYHGELKPQYLLGCKSRIPTKVLKSVEKSIDEWTKKLSFS